MPVQRWPQSVQSAPVVHIEYSDPAPPSSQVASLEYEHESTQVHPVLLATGAEEPVVLVISDSGAIHG